jgi:hypothetical protein
MRQDHEADHPHPSSVEVKNGGAIPLLPICLHGMVLNQLSIRATLPFMEHEGTLLCWNVAAINFYPEIVDSSSYCDISDTLKYCQATCWYTSSRENRFLVYSPLLGYATIDEAVFYVVRAEQRWNNGLMQSVFKQRLGKHISSYRTVLCKRRRHQQ